jgi:hypothetical protein
MGICSRFADRRLSVFVIEGALPVLRCQACEDERKKLQPDLVALRPRHPEGDPPLAKRRASGRT